MEQLKFHINEEMKNPTFLEYLRLRKQPGIGDVKAMKVGCEHFKSLSIPLPHTSTYHQSDITLTLPPDYHGSIT
jgi:hypothetical protein